MSFKKIYIAGKYSGENREKVNQNILKAKLAHFDLLKAGWNPFCPHTHSAHYEDDLPEFTWEDWLSLCKEWLETCECIYLLSGWEDSKGANIELEYAIEKGIKVYYQKDGVPKP